MTIFHSIVRGFFLQRFIIAIGLRPRHKKLLQRARLLYPFIVAQARQPKLYRDWGISDDKDGRFEMLSLHLFLIYDRLRQEPCTDPNDDVTLVGEFLAEVAVADLEHNLREMGVGDLGVGRRVQKMTKRHYTRLDLYRQLFSNPNNDQSDQEIGETLIEYTFSNDKGVAPLAAGQGAPQLMAYIRQNQQNLAKQDIQSVLSAPNFHPA